jgi:chromatin remodeling complex protein RSC6
VKARLQEAKSTKSPETLKRIEERAAQLHLLHVEATQQRAAKENRRAKDVVAARLRREASSRQNLLSRFEEQATHNEENRRLAQQRLTERLGLRKSGAAAVHAARAAAQAEKEHRAAVIRSREEECARQAEKAREQMVQRVAYHYKQALAKATAVKEGRKESLETKQARMAAPTLTPNPNPYPKPNPKPNPKPKPKPKPKPIS